MSTESEPTSCKAFRQWLESNGGEFHPETLFLSDSSGFRIVAKTKLPSDTKIVSCPFALVITKAVAQKALTSILGSQISSLTESWSARQWVSTYISFHWIMGEASAPADLAHFRYMDILPASDKLRTPLHFTRQELDLFRGTNLYGATLDREREWKAEWRECEELVRTVNPAWGEAYTWEYYLTAATYLSSRAFPSSILSETPTLEYSPNSEPVLLPGIDSLNHARGQPVSWVVTHGHPTQTSPNPTTQDPQISLILHTPTQQGNELFNNYGAKPNSEFILGYGFSLPKNPEDTIVLKVGGIEGRKWEIGRSARGVDGLWDEILGAMAENIDEATYEDKLDASSMLMEMLQSLVDRLPAVDKDEGNLPNIRPEVVSMLFDYVEGQRDILESLVTFAKEKEQGAFDEAREQGIELVIEDDE
ncbi:SET domain-containing protein [Pluteus cervinus]|uniref:SET domain-containing protein n=1 Tax=Pluteus cervinus TaxID=181527 RepID=A0ACD3AF96_9AGAR|nr:SET domain-containing protein [Pluteus cervinus]